MAESASAAEFLVLILTGIMGLSHLLQPAIWTRFFTALAGMGSPGVIAHALLSLWSVMIIVPFHWVRIGPGVIVTLWGWALLAKAVFGLCLAPDIALSSLSGRTDRDFRLAGALQLAVAGAAGWALVWKLVHPARFERATFAFGGQHSIQLSYGCLSLHLGQSRRVRNLNLAREVLEIARDIR